MAGEYQKEKYTRAQRLQNWFYYHWKLLLFVLVLLAFALMLLGDVLGRTQYDFTVGILSTKSVPENLRVQLEEQLNSGVLPLDGLDMNGDGEVHIQVQVYQVVPPTEREDEPLVDADTQMSAVTQLSAALLDKSSIVFLAQTDWLTEYQQSYAIFGDGSSAEAVTVERLGEVVTTASDCAGLAQLDLQYEDANGALVDGMDDLAEFSIGVVPNRSNVYQDAQEYQAYLQLFAHLNPLA